MSLLRNEIGHIKHEVPLVNDRITDTKNGLDATNIELETAKLSIDENNIELRQKLDKVVQDLKDEFEVTRKKAAEVKSEVSAGPNVGTTSSLEFLNEKINTLQETIAATVSQWGETIEIRDKRYSEKFLEYEGKVLHVATETMTAVQGLARRIDLVNDKVNVSGTARNPEAAQAAQGISGSCGWTSAGAHKLGGATATAYAAGGIPHDAWKEAAEAIFGNAGPVT